MDVKTRRFTSYIKKEGIYPYDPFLRKIAFLDVNMPCENVSWDEIEQVYDDIYSHFYRHLNFKIHYGKYKTLFSDKSSSERNKSFFLDFTEEETEQT